MTKVTITIEVGDEGGESGEPGKNFLGPRILGVDALVAPQSSGDHLKEKSSLYCVTKACVLEYGVKTPDRNDAEAISEFLDNPFTFTAGIRGTVSRLTLRSFMEVDVVTQFRETKDPLWDKVVALKSKDPDYDGITISQPDANIYNPDGTLLELSNYLGSLA